MSYAELLDLLRSRRSVRRFTAERPSRELLTHLIEAATTAPSASNKQPWRFFVLEDAERIRMLAGEVGAVVEEIARHVEPASAAAFRAYGDYFTRFEAAPVVIAALYRPLTVLSHLVDSGLSLEARERIALLERNSGLIGTAMALQNLLLAAHALGLGASGLTGPLVAEHRLRARLEIPDGWQIAALVAVGYADETPAPPARKPAAAVVRWLE